MTAYDYFTLMAYTANKVATRNRLNVKTYYSDSIVTLLSIMFQKVKICANN